MPIAWYLGFGWVAIAILVATGIGINVTRGPVAWALYAPFIVVAVYMTARFRLFSSERWRRIHARAMLDYGRFAGQAFDEAKKAGRDFDPVVPCRRLAERLGVPAGEIDALLGEGRKAFYERLVDLHPAVFQEGVATERRDQVLDGVRRDVATSELGPDVVIARAIEQRCGTPEAARYLRALLLGRVR